MIAVIHRIHSHLETHSLVCFAIQPKPLKKLSIETFSLNGMRVLLRLDLDIPIVGGVVLDRTKIDSALPTIKFLMEHGAKSVVIMGHRGRPRGFRNSYLSLQPLVEEFSNFLQVSSTTHILLF